MFMPPQIVEMCLKYITHDPNYNYDDYEDDEGQMDMDEDDEGEEDDEYSDDDDMSWKVRGLLILYLLVVCGMKLFF